MEGQKRMAVDNQEVDREEKGMRRGGGGGETERKVDLALKHPSFPPNEN